LEIIHELSSSIQVTRGRQGQKKYFVILTHDGLAALFCREYAPDPRSAGTAVSNTLFVSDSKLVLSGLFLCHNFWWDFLFVSRILVAI
jgi:hypothetical protein